MPDRLSPPDLDAILALRLSVAWAGEALYFAAEKDILPGFTVAGRGGSAVQAPASRRVAREAEAGGRGWTRSAE